MKKHIQKIMILAFTFIFALCSLATPKIEVKAANTVSFYTKEHFQELFDAAGSEWKAYWQYWATTDNYSNYDLDSVYDAFRCTWDMMTSTKGFLGALGQIAGCTFADVDAFLTYAKNNPSRALQLIKTFNNTKIDSRTISSNGGSVQHTDNGAHIQIPTVNNNSTVEFDKADVDYFRSVAMGYMEEYDGYYLYPTTTSKDVSNAIWNQEPYYSNFRDNVDTLLKRYEFVIYGDVYSGSDLELVVPKDTKINQFVKNGKLLEFYNNDWTSDRYCQWITTPYKFKFTLDMFDNPYKESPYYYMYPEGVTEFSSDNMQVGSNMKSTGSPLSIGKAASPYDIKRPEDLDFYIITKDARNVRIWKTKDAAANYGKGTPAVYMTTNYNISTVNNVVSGDTYNNCDMSTDYNNIQNQINNNGDGTMNVADSIVNNYFNGNNGSGNNSDDNGNGGGNALDVIKALTEGLSSLLGVIATLIGNVMQIIGDLLQTFFDTLNNLLELLTGGFADFLTAAFPFIPEEIWKTIILGIEVMVIVAILKAVRS